MKKVILAVGIPLVLIAILTIPLLNQGGYQNVTPDWVQNKLEHGDKLMLIDVREPSEYARGHLPGAVLIPLGVVEQQAAQLDPQQDYVIYCFSGDRSEEAAKILSQKGFKHIKNMTGGLLNYKGPLVR